ncbi:MAG TPA: hypothetical protein VNC50_09575 [Planctomycetia bacterium]|jgi:hypothetical protein|nr:hypothetical protein [Planctomycetia bacterium]
MEDSESIAGLVRAGGAIKISFYPRPDGSPAVQLRANLHGRTLQDVVSIEDAATPGVIGDFCAKVIAQFGSQARQAPDSRFG